MRAGLFGLLLILFASAQTLPPASNPVQIQVMGSPLQLSVVGSLDFGQHTLTATPQTLTASAVPTLQILDPSGSGAGWHLEVVASPLTCPNGTLPASSLRLRASGGSLTALRGQPLSAGGPAETGLTGDLSQPLKALSAQVGAGMGTYQWRPAPSGLQLSLPLEARAGTYQGTLTFSIYAGP